MVKFYDYGLEKSAYNSIFRIRIQKSNRYNTRNEIAVPTTKVDDIIRQEKLQSVNLIKIDAELSELCVLRGIVQTLKKYKPNIILEVGNFGIEGIPGSRELIKFLEIMDCCPYELKDGCLKKHTKKAHYGDGNLFFISKDSEQSILEKRLSNGTGCETI